MKLIQTLIIPLFLFANSSFADDCGAIDQIKTQKDLYRSLYSISLIHQKLLVPSPLDRHGVGMRLNSCKASPNSKALVISFAGTGSYDPRSFDLITRALKCMRGKMLPLGLQSSIYKTVQEVLHSKGKATRWSAVESGPISQFFDHPSLAKYAQGMDFASFPSEESEMIADANNISMDHLLKSIEEISRSIQSFPKGIENALHCTSHYLKSAAKLRVSPKIIILSHSSGGRTAVKFAEHLKMIKDVKIDLVFSIDPVIEAHEALIEVASQYVGKFRDYLIDYVPMINQKNDQPVNVWSRVHSDRLYKPRNVDQWLSVYQNVDSDGIKGPVKFGIHGSKVANADLNRYIRSGLSSDAHGAIAYHKRTKELFVQAVIDLFN